VSSVHVRMAEVVFGGEEWAPLHRLDESTALLATALRRASPVAGYPMAVTLMLAKPKFYDVAAEVREGAVNALRTQAAAWRELLRLTPDPGDVEMTLLVWDDWRQRQGLPSWVDERATKAAGERCWSESAPRALAETPELVTWLEAWLESDKTRSPATTIGCHGEHAQVVREHFAPSIEAHLPALRAHVQAQWEAMTVPCSRCINGWEPTFRRHCARCGGLGRAAPWRLAG